MFSATITRIILFYTVAAILSIWYAQCSCPADNGILRRVGNTRFYIIHPDTRGNFVTFTEAFDECTNNGLEMAKIKNMRTLAIVGRELEKIVEANKLKDTWYWLDAKFNPAKDVYEWGQTSSEGEIQYSNFLYRPPRPTGVAGFVNYKGEYHVNHNVEQCITLALPWPGKGDPHGKGVLYGHHTMLDERPCESKQRRHAICESKDPACDTVVNDPFVLTEDKVDYFEDGNWIFGDRRYVINWKQRAFQESFDYCKSLNMELFQPELNETGLIPYIKMWSRHVTVSQFWTGYSFNSIDKDFLNPSKVNIFKGAEWKQDWNESLQARTNKLDTDFCVAMVHSYEFKGQLPCVDQTSPDCTWSFVDYVPANCNNYLGTICQYQNKSSRDNQWNPKYIQDVDLGLRETAMTKEFGYAGNKEALRSKYKQTFGILYCPPGYRMLKAHNPGVFKIPPAILATQNKTTKSNSTKVPPPKIDNVYLYDYKETYWVLRKRVYNVQANSSCLISTPKDQNGFERTIKVAPCTEWHFYMCEKTSNKTKPFTAITPQTPPKMIWKEGPQPRIYPIAKGGKLGGRMDDDIGLEDYSAGGSGREKVTGNDRFILKTVNQTKKAFTLFRLKS